MRLAFLTMAAAALAPAEIYLNVSVNHAAARVAAGSPILIMASAAGDAGATREFGVTMTGPAGEAIAVAERAGLLQTVTIDEIETTTRVWVLPPDEAARLRPGRYSVRASQGDWRSPAAEFEVDMAAPPDPLLLSRWEQVEGRPARALEILDEALTQSPASTPLLLRKAEVLAAQRADGEAIQVIDQVLAVWEQDDRGDGDQAMEAKMLRAALVRRLLTPQMK